MKLQKSKLFNSPTSDERIGFIFNDLYIINPYIDESGRFSVDPQKYYGLSNDDVMEITLHNNLQGVYEK